ncbi:MAG TPA: immunoglobulin domain-containing protein [Terriglobales bacterium]
MDWARLISSPCRASDPSYAGAAMDDSDGNIYVGSGDSTGLVKFDSAGNVLWRWNIPEVDCSAAFLQGRALGIDASNNIYFFGGIWGRVTVGTNRYTDTLSAALFAKMSPNQTVAFGKIAYNLYAQSALLTPSAGQFLIGGSINDPNSLRYEGITLAASANSDIAVMKVNTDGSPVWARRGSGGGYDYLAGLASTPTGDIFVSGTTFQSSSFGMGGVSTAVTSSKGVLLIKMDAGGTGHWIKSVASSFEPTVCCEPVSSAVAYSARDDSVIWAGDFTGTLTLASQTNSSIDGKDVFVAKMASAGVPSWVKVFGGTNDQFASALAVDTSGNIYVAGFFFGQIAIGQTTFTSRGKEDIFIAKLQDDGTVIWAKQIGYSGAERINSLGFTRRGELLIAGQVEAGLSLDGTFLETTGPADGFVAKFRPEGLPPKFIIQPEGKIVSAGMTVTLQSEASSSLQPQSYQWWFNGARIAAQTNSSLTLSNIQSSQGGSYFVSAENSAGVTLSDTAILTYTDASTLVLSIHPSIQIFGTPGRTYTIEYTTGVRTAAHWTEITNLTLNATPQLWVDPEAAVGSNRFYRVLLQPVP